MSHPGKPAGRHQCSAIQMRFALGDAGLHSSACCLKVRTPAEPNQYPVLARGVRMHIDPVTGDPVLLFPEGVLPLDESTFEIVRLCSGERTVPELVALLAEEYDADKETLRSHVIECLG